MDPLGKYKGHRGRRDKVPSEVICGFKQGQTEFFRVSIIMGRGFQGSKYEYLGTGSADVQACRERK